MAKCKYKIHPGIVPKWLRKCLTPYRKMDGSIGYELDACGVTTELNVGDVITKRGNKFYYRTAQKMKIGGRKQNESKNLHDADQED